MISKERMKALYMASKAKQLLKDLDDLTDAINNGEVKQALFEASKLQQKHQQVIQYLYEKGVLKTNDLRTYYQQATSNI